MAHQLPHNLLRAAALIVFLAGGTATAQSLDDIRDVIRQSLRDSHAAKSFAGLVVLSEELELSGARLDFDDAGNTEMWALTLPIHESFDLGAGRPGFYLEGSLGYVETTQYALDVWEGTLPGFETRVDSEWRTYGGLIGTGLEFQVANNLTFTPIVDVGIARIENDTDYSGPGAAATAALADGIVFNYDLWTWTAGPAGRIAWQKPLGDGIRLEVVSRYDIRWVGSLDEDDDAQEFTTRSQIGTVRADLTGPTGLQPFGGDLRWRATGAVRQFFEGDLWDSESIVQVGGALELEADLPIGRAIGIEAAAVIGDNVNGWILGMSLVF